MTQEDKELLLKDLCARLPYGVMVNVNGNNEKVDEINPFEGIITCGFQSFDINECKPYLRPMSSMTDEEKKKFKIISNCKVYKDDFDNDEDSEYFTYIDKLTEIETFDWLLENHFDFMGLIPKGLAIEVTESNNPYGN